MDAGRVAPDSSMAMIGQQLQTTKARFYFRLLPPGNQEAPIHAKIAMPIKKIHRWSKFRDLHRILAA